LAATDHIRLKHDKQYALADFGSLLQQRPDLTDELASAFDELLSIINHVPDPRIGTENLLESGFFSCLQSPVSPKSDSIDELSSPCSRGLLSCLPSRVNSWAEKRTQEAPSDHDSDSSFEDAIESPSKLLIAA